MRRSKIRRRSFMAALLGVLLAWGITGNVKAKNYRTQVNIAQQRALIQMCEYLDSMETSLQKAACAATPSMLGVLSAELRTEATGAKASLSALSSGDTALYNMYKFLSQVSAYTAALQQRAAAGETLPQKDRQTLSALHGYAKRLSAQFNYMADLLDAGLFSFEAIRQELLQADESGGDMVSYLSAAADAEESMQDFPTLIYDGPYSDHITERASQLLKEASAVSAAKAKEIAAGALQTEPDLLVDAGTSAGKIPCYQFYRDKYRVAVTVNGGYTAYVLSDHVGGEDKIGTKEAIARAAAYLQKLGYRDMESTYSANENGVCLANFACKTGDYICYPDLIKVGVSLTDGSIVSMDARDYLMNHVERTVPAAQISAEQAARAVAPSLQVKRLSKAVIPTPGGYEKYAYELLCTTSGEQDVLVYIDTSTGEEDDILLLLYADGGALTK